MKVVSEITFPILIRVFRQDSNTDGLGMSAQGLQQLHDSMIDALKDGLLSALKQGVLPADVVFKGELLVRGPKQ